MVVYLGMTTEKRIYLTKKTDCNVAFCEVRKQLGIVTLC